MKLNKMIHSVDDSLLKFTDDSSFFVLKSDRPLIVDWKMGDGVIVSIDGYLEHTVESEKTVVNGLYHTKFNEIYVTGEP